MSKKPRAKLGKNTKNMIGIDKTSKVHFQHKLSESVM